MPYDTPQNAPEMYEEANRDDLIDLGWITPEDKEIIPLLIKQGWSPQEAIAAAATLSNSAKPGEARRYRETPGGLQTLPTNVDTQTRWNIDRGQAAIDGAMRQVGTPASGFDMARAKMREGFKAVGGGLKVDGKEEMVKRNEQVAAQKMLREYLIAQDAQRAEEEKKTALKDMVHNLRRGLDNIGQARLHGYQLTPDSMYVVNQLNQNPTASAAPSAANSGVLGASTMGPRNR